MCDSAALPFSSHRLVGLMLPDGAPLREQSPECELQGLRGSGAPLRRAGPAEEGGVVISWGHRVVLGADPALDLSVPTES